MVRVLVVDDDAAVLKFIAQILRSEAIEPIIAPDEETALAAVAKAPDAVVLDLYMPQSRSFYTRARKAGFDGPIIISAPYGAHSARRELMAEAAFVTPIDPASLVSLIKDVIAEAISKQRDIDPSIIGGQSGSEAIGDMEASSDSLHAPSEHSEE